MVDGSEIPVSASPGSTVQQVIKQAGITLGSLDRTDPPDYTLMTDQLRIRVIRVSEEYKVTQEPVPYQQQVLTNDSMPSGERRMIQPGENGLNEITTRIVSEDGTQISSHQVKIVAIKAALPEIIMVGVQEPFASITIPGRLAYLTAGNAWIMDGSTGQRTPVVSTGDLDGRIFRLSEDGEWLLFTRALVENTSVINSLWAARIDSNATKLIDLQVSNVIHFAAFVPGDNNTIAYSTVEPRQAAPGWQANNDLYQLQFAEDGTILDNTQLLSSSSGGIYGWWGTVYSWSPGGDRLLYARPDGIGFVDLASASLSPLVDIVPFQTNSSWAWITGLDWDASGKIIYFTSHGDPTATPSSENSSIFSLTALNIENPVPVTLAEGSGMFSYPVVSTLSGNENDKVAYLQAVFPDRSGSSSYRMVIMDQDGSNKQTIFPAAGSGGLEPQRVVWSPAPLEDGSVRIALLYQGNLWFVDANDGSSSQITGDGLTDRIDWK